MQTFVMIHASYMGGWVWRDVARHLRAAGHTVYPLTLTGFGDRSHLLTPDVGLDTHVQDILNLLRFEELRDVTLVGWAYGAVPVTVAADLRPDLFRQVIYLNGFVPRDGESQLQLFEPGWRDVVLEHHAETLKRGEPGLQVLGEGFYRELIPDDERRAWFASHLTPHVFKAMEDLAFLSGAGEAVPHTYLHLTGSGDTPVTPHVQHLRRWYTSIPGWTLHESSLGHFAAVYDAAAVAELLQAHLLPETGTTQDVANEEQA